MGTNGMKYSFSAKVWYSEWYFVSLPQDLAVEIRELFKSREEGWGRLKVTANIGNSEWKTAVWLDAKKETYLLPIKKDVRTKEKIDIDTSVTVNLWLQSL